MQTYCDTHEKLFARVLGAGRVAGIKANSTKALFSRVMLANAANTALKSRIMGQTANDTKHPANWRNYQSPGP
ncbi:hypothetical protein D3C81_1659020 [compost metagenome]